MPVPWRTPKPTRLPFEREPWAEPEPEPRPVEWQWGEWWEGLKGQFLPPTPEREAQLRAMRAATRLPLVPTKPVHPVVARYRKWLGAPGRYLEEEPLRPLWAPEEEPEIGAEWMESFERRQDLLTRIGYMAPTLDVNLTTVAQRQYNVEDITQLSPQELEQLDSRLSYSFTQLKNTPEGWRKLAEGVGLYGVPQEVASNLIQAGQRQLEKPSPEQREYTPWEMATGEASAARVGAGVRGLAQIPEQAGGYRVEPGEARVYEPWASTAVAPGGYVSGQSVAANIEQGRAAIEGAQFIKEYPDWYRQYLKEVSPQAGGRFRETPSAFSAWFMAEPEEGGLSRFEEAQMQKELPLYRNYPQLYKEYKRLWAGQISRPTFEEWIEETPAAKAFKEAIDLELEETTRREMLPQPTRVPSWARR